MGDLFLIAAIPPLVGGFVGQAASVLRLMNHRPILAREVFELPRSEVAAAPDYPPEWDLNDKKAYEEIEKEAQATRLKQAAKVMASCPDASCDSIADALNLPRLTVRRLSKGGRKGSKVTHYHPNEIMELANA